MASACASSLAARSPAVSPFNVAAEQGERVIPDQTPEQMVYYRVDSFEFARSGIPSVHLRAGIDYIGKPPQYRKEKLGAYIAND